MLINKLVHTPTRLNTNNSLEIDLILHFFLSNRNALSGVEREGSLDIHFLYINVCYCVKRWRQ